MTNKELYAQLRSQMRTIATAEAGDEELGPLKSLPGKWKSLPGRG